MEAKTTPSLRREGWGGMYFTQNIPLNPPSKWDFFWMFK
jgi:hypothetical protein